MMEESLELQTYSAFFLTVAIGNCMVKVVPPVNFCSDENIQTIFGTKLEDFFCAIVLNLVVYHVCFQDGKLCLLVANDKLDGK
jgi:hypothetical protein